MAAKVSTGPNFPPLSFMDQRLTSWAGDLIQRLTFEFTAHARRLNQALTEDGTESMASALALANLTFAQLPAGKQGMLAVVTDSSTATVGNTIAGGGANKVLAVFNSASHWIVVIAL